MEIPLVSIVIPVYNGSDYMRQAIDSALGQDYDNFEVIVVNDGSTDGGETERIALSYGSSIRYIAKENGGVASALNLAIREMAGEYFSWLSHDDIYLPGKLSSEMDTLMRAGYDKPAVVYSNFYEIDLNGRITYGVYPPRKYAGNSLYLLSNHIINGCTLLVPKVCFEETGCFNEMLRSTQDYDLWFRFSKKYRFVHTDRFLVKSRLHEQQGSRTIATHMDARSELHIGALDNLTKEDISGAGFSVRNFYLWRSARLFKEGLPAAADHSLQLARQNGNAGIGFSFVKNYYKFVHNRLVSAVLYFMKLTASPGRWGLFWKIVRGRLKTK